MNLCRHFSFFWRYLSLDNNIDQNKTTSLANLVWISERNRVHVFICCHPQVPACHVSDYRKDPRGERKAPFTFM